MQAKLYLIYLFSIENYNIVSQFPFYPITFIFICSLFLFGSFSNVLANKKWTIHFNKSTLPSNKTHDLVTDYPAYFVTTSCEGNLHHFLKDSAVGLFGALKETNRYCIHIKLYFEQYFCRFYFRFSVHISVYYHKMSVGT